MKTLFGTADMTAMVDLKRIGILWWLVWGTAALDIGQHPQVSVKQGVLRGKTMTSNSGQEFEAFLGIPYGKVNQRFTKPEPAEPWKEVLDATQDGLSCKQIKLLGKNSTSEDCLSLNIYRRKNHTEESGNPLLPVLVYIYGGGFVGGVSDSKSYGPGRLMDGVPIVLVLFNYRTGSFGFLSTNDEVCPGNFGLFDQLMALQWIRDNIKAFGGDPNKVTISGESAGGASVMLHLVSPLSKDLFHGAIIQSGNVLPPWSAPKNPLNTTQRIAENLNCPTETTVAMVECMREVDADALIIASNLSQISGGYLLSTIPVIDGHFVTEPPLKSLKEGGFNKVPVISGVTANESARIIAALLSQGDKIVNILLGENWEQVLPWVAQDQVEYLRNNTIKKAIKELYSHHDTNNSSDIIVQRIKLVDDILFNIGNDKAVRLLSESGTPVFMYVFDHSSRDISTTNLTGHPDVSHASELYLLFNRNLSSTNKYSDETEQVSKNMVNLWTNFAAYGNPTPSGPLVWSPVLPAEHLNYLNISTHLLMEEGYLTERMTFWDSIIFQNGDQ